MFHFCSLAFQPRCLCWPPWSTWPKAARVAVGTRGYAGPDGVARADLAAHPDTKVAGPPCTTVARIRLPLPLLAADEQRCALTDWLHGVLEDDRDVPILQVRLHAGDDVIQASTGRLNPTVNKTQRRHVGTEGTTRLFADHKPTTKKAGKDKYPFKHPHLDTLRYVVDSKPAMSLHNYSLTSHSPYRWKPELVGLTTPVLMESEDAILPLPMCHALPLIGTSEPVKQVRHLPGSEQGTLGVGSDRARVQGGFPGEGWQHAGEHEDRGGQRGPEVVSAVTPFPFVTKTMDKAVAALVGSIPQLKPYTAIKGKARAEQRHHIQTIMRELLVDPEAVVVESGGELYIPFAGHDDDEDPRVGRAIGR